MFLLEWLRPKAEASLVRKGEVIAPDEREFHVVL